MTTSTSVHLTPDHRITWHDDRDGGYLMLEGSDPLADRLYLFPTGPLAARGDVTIARRQWEAIAEAARVALHELDARRGPAMDDPTETDEPTDEPAHEANRERGLDIIAAMAAERSPAAPCPIHGATCRPVWHRHDAAPVVAPHDEVLAYTDPRGCGHRTAEAHERHLRAIGYYPAPTDDALIMRAMDGDR